jgi:tetratricopeptide (TPR) repeat protein/DNA-binding winged helix-turn-helix (wHTH) protein
MTDQVGTPQSVAPRRFYVGEAEIRPDTNTVLLNGDERYLRSQAMQVLTYLLQRPRELVSKDALHRAIWNETAVTDDALVQCVVEIRKALGDDPRRPRFVRTVPKGGYCFIGPVKEVSETVEPPAIVEVPPIVEQPPIVEVTRINLRLPRAAIEAAPVAEVPSRATWWQWPMALAVVAVIGGVVLASNWPRNSIAFPIQPGKARVIVLGFDNPSNDEELNWLQRGLPEMIVTDLARSPGLSVLTPSQLRQLAGGDQGSGDLAAALDLARRANADAFITGSFSAVGDALRVDARVHQADGTLIGSESLTAARREVVLAEVDRLAAGLSRVLGHPLNAQQSASRLSDVMTGNLSAFREYTLGVQKGNALQWSAALSHFEAAAKADPNFAMAHARIGYTYAVTMGWPQPGEAFLAKAFQLSDRLREQDRLSIVAWYALAKLDFEGAISPLRQLVARYPDDIESYWLLSRTLRGEERWDEAQDMILSGLRVNPNDKDLYNELYGLYSATWRLDLALEAVKKYVALSPNEPNAHDSLGLSYHQAGRYEEALRSFEQAVALDPAFDIAVFHIGNVYAEQGRYREAIAAYQKHADMMRFPTMRMRGLSAQGWIAYARGDIDRAWRLMTEVEMKDTLRYDVASVALARGDRARFDAEMRKPFRTSNRGSRPPRMVDHYMRGLVAKANHQEAEAIKEFTEATKHPPTTWTFPSWDDGLAQTLFEYGRLEEAAQEYQRLLSHNPFQPRYHYRLAQIADRQGRPAEARRSYEKVIALWPKADPDVPELVRARAWLKDAGATPTTAR